MIQAILIIYLETPSDSPLPSGATTPQVEPDTRHIGGQVNGKTAFIAAPRPPPKKKVILEYDSDIDPDDLLPKYIETKSKIFEKTNLGNLKGDPKALKGVKEKNNRASSDPELQKLQRKIKTIEDDVLFDRYIADQQWEAKRIQLEKSAAAQRVAVVADSSIQHGSEHEASSEDETSREAARIGKELLEEDASDDDGALADLFASLPVNEVDPLTGKTNTVVNGSNGIKVTIRDYGKWTGLSPQRILEEACRARDSGFRMFFTTISESSFAHRHSLRITWSKSQELLLLDAPPGIDVQISMKQYTFSMTSIATPDSKQSEAYIATVALFLVFGSSSKEDKVSLRLPATWRDLWAELAEQRKDKIDSEDREAVRSFRDMVREKRDQELEDGVLIHGAFRNRGVTRAADGADSGPSKDAKSLLSSETYQRIWSEKSSTPSYHAMLVCSNHQFLHFTD